MLWSGQCQAARGEEECLCNCWRAVDNDGPDSPIQHHTEDTQINVNLPTSGIRSKGAKIFVIFYFVCVLCVSLISQYKRRSGETRHTLDTPPINCQWTSEIRALQFLNIKEVYRKQSLSRRFQTQVCHSCLLLPCSVLSNLYSVSVLRCALTPAHWELRAGINIWIKDWLFSYHLLQRKLNFIVSPQLYAALNS